MKRDLSFLDKQTIEEIRAWLDCNEKKEYCPFNYSKCMAVCYSIFPFLQKIKYCPCRKYKPSYVKKIAKKIIKEVG